MKPIDIKNLNDGLTIITTETKRIKGMLWWKKEVIYIREFKAVKRIAGDYWTWLELPDMKLVPDDLSFQLDAWKTHGIT